MKSALIEYRTSVYVAAGWRGVIVNARATLSKTGRMATIDEVTAIDGETPARYMSRTGSRRQAYNGLSIAQREQGARKRVSTLISCEVDE